MGSRQIHFARNALVHAALESKADYIAFIDADMTFPDDVLHQLYFNSKDICGVLYKGRLKPHPYNIFFWNKDKTAMEQVRRTWKPPRAKLIEVDAVGTGVMLIKRKVFDEIGRPYFYYEQNRSEDIMFCQKCREHGIRVYVDTTLKCGHIGDEIFL
jgi:cellulose synthase/poly-beta-1,6-N-acetylglucosamine synthase-like glycosyltransferase